MTASRCLTLTAALSLVGTACFDPTDYDDLATASRVLRVDKDTLTAPADGATLTDVGASLPANASPDRRSVSVATTLGIFESGGQSGTVTADSVGHVLVRLRSPIDTGTARVRLTAGGVTREIIVKFARAYPTSVLVDLAKFAVPATATDEVTVTAILRRSAGTPTRGTPVTFTAPLGRFAIATVSDDKGMATIRFSPGAAAAPGSYTITATAPKSDQQEDTVRGQAVLEVIAPPDK